MNRIAVFGLLLAHMALASVHAATLNCSIHPPKDATDAQLAKLAKVTQAQAEKKAVARLKSPAKVVGAELQVESGCLFWTLILKEAGKAPIKELKVDAGTGKISIAKLESGK